LYGLLGTDTLRGGGRTVLQAHTGRLLQTWKYPWLYGYCEKLTASFVYDAAGNQQRQYSYVRQTVNCGGAIASQELASYYDAAQRLRAADRRACIRWPPEDDTRADKCQHQWVDTVYQQVDFRYYSPTFQYQYVGPSQVATAAFEEYRYDALGRRVCKDTQIPAVGEQASSRTGVSPS
jgi:hypothetical protein